MIAPESSPSAGWLEVERVMVDPTLADVETTIARLSEERISAYVAESRGRRAAPEVMV